MRSRGFNGFLTQRQRPLDFEVRYKSGIFGLVSERCICMCLPRLTASPLKDLRRGCPVFFGGEI